MAIACWYYPNPDVATSNAVGEGGLVNVTMSVETLQALKKLLQENPM
jgi:Ca2+:H+ antiporter